MAPYDYAIVGAGTAGCVLANRLSADGRHRVLLVEAGPDHVPGTEPASIRDIFPSSAFEPDHFWPNLVAEVGARPAAGGPRFSRPYQQARMVGGGSNIMGMIALRGLAADYDEWSSLGAEGWDWAGVLPYFRRLERDLDFPDSPLHGAHGPMPVRRLPRAGWPPFCAAVGEAMAARGHAFVEDANAGAGDGLFETPMTNLPSGRVSASMAYLGADVRRRPNLDVLAAAEVEKILFEGTRATGLALKDKPDVRAREVILAAGAIHSPLLLLRSGIGPAEAIRKQGAALIANRPGVGAQLMNHPAVYIATWLRAASRQDRGEPGWSQNSLRHSSGLAGCPAGDMLTFAFNKTGNHAVGRAIGSINVSVYKSFSRGSVSLGADGAPLIRFGLLDDGRDRERLIDGVGDALALLVDPRVAAHRETCFVAAGPAVQRAARPRVSGRAFSAIARTILGLSLRLRRRLLAGMAVDPVRLLGDRAALTDFVLAAAFPMGHVSGTCRMGGADDAGAVTDGRCRVMGVSGLRVADAAIMPSIPSANTHLPTLMIAEKAADMILGDANKEGSR